MDVDEEHAPSLYMAKHEATYDPDQTYVVVLEWLDGDVTVHGPYDIQEAAIAAAHDIFTQHQAVYIARHRRLQPPLWTEGAARGHLTGLTRLGEDSHTALMRSSSETLE